MNPNLRNKRGEINVLQDSTFGHICTQSNMFDARAKTW
jgi:hypothetical protein